MTTVLGHRGYLGAVVKRRWAELGAEGDYQIVTFDDLNVIWRLAQGGPGVVVPSTDAIAEDTKYAQRKRYIEAMAADEGLVVIRAGIIDIRPERQHAEAYCRWECNPLTPLEWADLAWEKRDQPGVHVAGREPLTRYAVASAVSQVFGTPQPRKRCGRSLNRVQAQDRERPDIVTALREFKEWLSCNQEVGK